MGINYPNDLFVSQHQLISGTIIFSSENFKKTLTIPTKLEHLLDGKQVHVWSENNFAGEIIEGFWNVKPETPNTFQDLQTSWPCEEADELFCLIL